MKVPVLSVTQLNEYVRKTLAGDPMLRQICLSGELSNFKRHVSGHWYFSLKDEDAAINCAMFRQAASGVRFSPENGMHVKLFGSVGLYSKTGSYQFYADMMEEEGLGELYLRFEALKRRLAEDGLFDPAQKKPLPLLPRGIGIITSKTGAVVHDIAQVAWRRNPSIPLFLCPVKVQGESAANEIAAAIRLVDQLPEVDVIIVGRGGGSMEDLWPFNEERVALAIAACHTPVISAVGHETDFTIADFVADLRAPTPSAAAELCVPTRESLLNELQSLQKAMEQTAVAALSRHQLRLAQVQSRLLGSAPDRRLEKQWSELNLLRERIIGVVAAKHDALQNRVERARLRLSTASPMETMKRGYSVALKNGKALKSIGEAEMGDRLQLRLWDGSLLTTVQEIETEE
ncbi:MAG: exodeoxyribonuclease VII large subunit [Eubacteriales bacterium]|nr:exodeoxyribonuclease VII large subunit [Eubacteriales bacterium]